MSAEPTVGVSEAKESAHQLATLVMHLHAVYTVLVEAVDSHTDADGAAKLLLARSVLGQLGKEVDTISARLGEMAPTGMFDEATMF